MSNLNTSVKVYGFKQQKTDKEVKNIVYPLTVTDEEKQNHFDLLFLNKEQNSHYAYISIFSKLVSIQKFQRENKIYIRKRCFTSFDD